jgi:hypothetical protein
MTTGSTAAARTVSHRLDTLWDLDYEPTAAELGSLYETAKKAQWNASTAIDWSRPVGREGPVLNMFLLFYGTDFFRRFSPEEQTDIEIRLSAWRLSQFLHGEQGALLVASQLVGGVPALDYKLYAATQVVDESRHVEVFERYVRKLDRIYPMDPRLRALIDEVLASERWELKLLGMQMLIEGLAIASFNLMHRQTGDPTLRQLLGYVLQDEGRHVNFGYLALKRAVPAMEPGVRAQLEDFALRACEALCGPDENAGLGSIREVWRDLGWDADRVWRDTAAARRAANRALLTAVLIPRLQRLDLMPGRVEGRYREMGLL